MLPKSPPNWNLGASRQGDRRKAWWPVLQGLSHLLGSPVPAPRDFPTTPSQLTREHTATGFSSSASQPLPSSSGSLRLAVNSFSRTETQSWVASPPLARTEGIIPVSMECHLITCSGIEPDGERPHHAGPASQGLPVCSLQSIIYQSTTPGRHAFTLACLRHVCGLGARWRSEPS